MLLYPINTVISDPSRVSGLTVGPRLQDWMDRVKSRPAYQRGFERLKEEERKAKEEKEKVEAGEQTVSAEQAGSGTA
jgi:glutathione S-transferase